MRWAQIDLRHGRLHVNRVKGGQEAVHPLHGPELRALRQEVRAALLEEGINIDRLPMLTDMRPPEEQERN